MSSLIRSVDDLHNIIPSGIINSSVDDSISVVVKTLLSSFLNTDTNITQFIKDVKTNCPSLMDLISQINSDSIKNINDPSHKQAVINLIMSAIMSIMTIRDSISNLGPIKVDDNTFNDFGFLLLIALLIITVIEKDKAYFNTKENCDMLFTFINFIQLSYMSLISTTHLLDDLKDFGEKIFSSCSCFKSQISTKDAQEKIKLKGIAFKHVVDSANAKKSN